MNTRYPDYKREFHKKCTREYTQNIIEKVENVIEWLKRLIQE
ncbi:HEPN domain-containing protein [Caldicellulosiruptor naganoensis]|uniref:HEPN domain-containing protein n=1 Tax=Caldicellulosiruptor naganoensis TaxID=29324 RepID=A0ABY7BJD3_9FIRM|nr:HEPN domain-containing protein [Caldicellulosiruptor naganoensis]WAM32714.1 HEPN domain-containing protein [Caldicellulosiruptor naganoensis]